MSVLLPVYGIGQRHRATQKAQSTTKLTVIVLPQYCFHDGFAHCCCNGTIRPDLITDLRCQNRSSGACQYEVEPRPKASYDTKRQSETNCRKVKTASFVCPNGQCSAEYDAIFVYRDAQHLTSTFTASAEKYFEQQMTDRF